MFSRGLAPSVELLLIEEHGLGVLVLLARRNICLCLIHAWTTHGVEFVDLHLRWLSQVIGLVVVLDWYVAHGLADGLLPELLLRLLVVVRQVASLADILHRHCAVGAPSAGRVTVLTDSMQALTYELLGPFRSIVQAHFCRVRVRLLALLRAVLLVACFRVHIRLIPIPVRATHNLRRLDLRVTLVVHIVALGVCGAAALILTLAMHLLRLSEASPSCCDPVVHLHPIGAGLLHVDRCVLARRLCRLADRVDLAHLDHLRLLMALSLAGAVSATAQALVLVIRIGLCAIVLLALPVEYLLLVLLERPVAGRVDLVRDE